MSDYEISEWIIILTSKSATLTSTATYYRVRRETIIAGFSMCLHVAEKHFAVYKRID